MTALQPGAAAALAQLLGGIQDEAERLAGIARLLEAATPGLLQAGSPGACPRELQRLDRLRQGAEELGILAGFAAARLAAGTVPGLGEIAALCRLGEIRAAFAPRSGETQQRPAEGEVELF